MSHDRADTQHGIIHSSGTSLAAAIWRRSKENHYGSVLSGVTGSRCISKISSTVAREARRLAGVATARASDFEQEDLPR